MPTSGSSVGSTHDGSRSAGTNSPSHSSATPRSMVERFAGGTHPLSVAILTRVPDVTRVSPAPNPAHLLAHSPSW